MVRLRLRLMFPPEAGKATPRVFCAIDADLELLTASIS
jgi:hypothetical protein